MALHFLGLVLGAGAQGSVELAVDRNSGKCFAVKVSSAVDAFSQEFNLVNSITPHVNIIKYHAWTRLPSRNCALLVQDVAGGRSLHCLIHQQFPRGLPESMCREYLRQLCSAVLHVHSKGIVHLDLKPRNILLSEGGIIKLADFGCACVVGSGWTRPVGTLHYMSPEMANNSVANGQQFRTPADIFSLGCILFEMLTGNPPFADCDTVTALTDYHHNAYRELPNAVVQHVSAESKEFLRKCIVFNETRRPTALQLIADPWFSPLQTTNVTAIQSTLAQQNTVTGILSTLRSINYPVDVRAREIGMN